jgi:PAS domain S-box-containing protein
MTDASTGLEREEHVAEVPTSDLALWEWLPGTDTLVVSPGWKALLGFGPDGLPDPWAEWTDRLHPDDRERVLAEVERIRLGRTASVSGEYRLRHRSGEYRWVLSQGAIVGRNPDGSPERIIGTHFDITRLKETERSLREQGALLRGVLSASPTPIFVKDAQGRFLLANRAMAADYGLSVEEIEGRANAEVHPYPEEVAAYAAVDREVLTTGATVAVDERFTRPNGDVAWYHTVKTPLQRADGSVDVLGISTEITESRRALEEIRRLNQQLEARDAVRAGELRRSFSLLGAALDSTADGILVVDLEGKVTFFNRQFLYYWRIPESLAATRDDARLLQFVREQLEDPVAFLARVRELYRSPEEVSFDVLKFKDGRVLERYSQPQRLDGRVVGRVWSFRDVTERRRAEEAARQKEEQLRQSHKMEAVGRLAGGVAHDFNNLLTGILGYTSLLLDDASLDPAARRDIDEIRKAADRAAALTAQLLAFSRKQVLQPKRLDLNAVVRNLGALLRRVIGEDVELVCRLDPALPPIIADPGQIEQVVLNLAVNARDAMPHGGRLELATTTGPRAGLGGGADRAAILIVSDTGSGMDQESCARVFEPFYTTKPGGTGLGLSMVYGIVKQSGGDIEVTSTPGRGTTFTISLPGATGASETTAITEAAEGGADAGSETILLVEDEDQVRALTHRILGVKGYRVLEAASPRAAMALSDDHPGPIDLLLTDVVLPELSGPALAERLRSRRPGLKILFMSGYPASVVGGDIFPAGERFLPKPFTPTALAARVREVLDDPSRDGPYSGRGPTTSGSSARRDQSAMEPS